MRQAILNNLDVTQVTRWVLDEDSISFAYDQVEKYDMAMVIESDRGFAIFKVSKRGEL